MSERLNWGLIGGGEGSQIGFAHRIGAELDGKFKFAAGALDVDPQRSREYGKRLGLDEDRAYGNWKEMLDSESYRDDRIDLVTCLLYTSPSPRDYAASRMPSSA